MWKRTRQSNKDKQDQELKAIKKADLDMLELAAAVGEICLKYLDESGFVLWSAEATSAPQSSQLYMGKKRNTEKNGTNEKERKKN